MAENPQKEERMNDVMDLQQEVARLKERIQLILEACERRERRAFDAGMRSFSAGAVLLPHYPDGVTDRIYAEWKMLEEEEGIRRSMEAGREP